MEMNNNNINNNNENNDANRRISRGRQKVAMVKMDNESNLQVTFSKRRSGLFKKASELCTLCGVELALIVFSPGRKVFSFGHPSVELVVDRFLNPQNYRTTSEATNSGTLQLIEAHRNANVRELNQQLTHVSGQLDVERKHGSELKKERKARVPTHWWEIPTEALNDMRHLEQLKSAMELLRRATTQQADRILIQTTANSNANSLLPPNFNSMNVNTPSFYGAVTGSAGRTINMPPPNTIQLKSSPTNSDGGNNNINNHNNHINHFNFSPMPPQMKPNTTSFNHFNHHMQPKSSPSSTPTNNIHHHELPMLPQSLPQSSQLVFQNPINNSQAMMNSHMFMINNNNGTNVGYGGHHGFFN
ncbi:hypothetical protein G4B88_002075 [Cannabis sativa]|uniref:MADS-box domain-containing protein n=1 Tax=Cannabis sativa TaxID=3483 RepID=A0A7J6EY90_CANSA|nr:hypothetical protein G4B88_002075 [Cannabis sativa]